MNGLRKTFAIAAAVSLVCLSATGAMAANKLIVKGTDGVTDKFVVTDSGSIGIGVSPPTYALEISGVPGGTARIINGTVGTSSAGGGGLIFTHNNGTTAAPTMPAAGNRLGFVLFGSKNGTANATAGGMSAIADGNWTAGASYPMYFSFLTVPAGSITQVERMRITSSGNTMIYGGLQMNKNAGSPAKPTCSAAVRGLIWFTQGAVAVADALEVCSKDAAENYAYRALY